MASRGVRDAAGWACPCASALRRGSSARETLRSADVPEAKADLIHAIYERIVVAGPEFVEAPTSRLRHTPTGWRHLLPEVVMASPAGFEPATGRLEGGCSVH